LAPILKTSPGLKVTESAISSCFELQYHVAADHRGDFVKSFNKTLFRNLGFETEFTESFYSVSVSRVLRGMHFQRPPADHAKLLYCVSGSILDVAVDLRRGSPTYGGYAAFELSAEAHTAAYLPRGMAHGFYVTQGPAQVVYHVSSEYSPSHDAGIRWDSFGFDWPDKEPIISKRDSEFQSLNKFDSPFVYTPPQTEQTS
jgi:dTDP-4-dehydrorhamnose 3,5-epimerase